MKHYKVEVYVNNDNPAATADLIHVLDTYNITSPSFTSTSGPSTCRPASRSSR